MATAPLATPAQVLDFWFGADPEKWFSKDDAFDAAIVEAFLPTYEAAKAGRLADWEAAPESALALILVLDQFPRNMFRGSARVFATDTPALAVAKRAVARGFDQKLELPKRNFFYLPFMHSEDLAEQERCVALSRQGRTKIRSNMPSCTRISSGGSAASLTATPFSGAPPRPRNRPFWMRAGSPADYPNSLAERG